MAVQGMMDPRMADRIARRISVTKRQKGLKETQLLISRLGINAQSDDGKQVMKRVQFWKDKPCSDDA